MSTENCLLFFIVVPLIHPFELLFFSSSAPPTFTDTPPQYVEAKEGGSITLTCTAFGNPKPSVGWLREGSLVVSSAKYKVNTVSMYPQNNYTVIYQSLFFRLTILLCRAHSFLFNCMGKAGEIDKWWTILHAKLKHYTESKVYHYISF